MASSPSPAVGKTTAIAPSKLHTFHENAREGDIPAIMASLRRHSQFKPITGNIGTFTGRPLEILAGNHTLMAFRQLAEADPFDAQWQKILVHWVDVDDDMAKRIVVADNQTGQLGGFDETKLAELVGSFDGDIDGLGFTDADIDALMALTGEGLEDTPPGDDGDVSIDEPPPLYSDKKDIPQYVPSDNPPELGELINTAKTDELLREIAAAAVPDEIKQVLIACAQRHTVINFQKVADYYASAPAEVQDLIESQALVILDYDDAIKRGYVNLTDRLADFMRSDLASEDRDYTL